MGCHLFQCNNVWWHFINQLFWSWLLTDPIILLVNGKCDSYFYTTLTHPPLSHKFWTLPLANIAAETYSNLFMQCLEINQFCPCSITENYDKLCISKCNNIVVKHTAAASIQNVLFMYSVYVLSVTYQSAWVSRLSTLGCNCRGMAIIPPVWQPPVWPAGNLVGDLCNTLCTFELIILHLNGPTLHQRFQVVSWWVMSYMMGYVLHFTPAIMPLWWVVKLKGNFLFIPDQHYRPPLIMPRWLQPQPKCDRMFRFQ